MSKPLTTLDTIQSSTSAVIDSVVHVTKNIKYYALDLNSANSGFWDMQFKDWISLAAIVVLPITFFLLQAKAKANKENKEYKSVRRKSYNKLKLISFCIESEIESLKETIIKFEKPETVHIVGTVLTIPFDEFKSIPEGIIEDVYFHKLTPLKNHSLTIELEKYGTEIDGLYKNIETLYCMYKERLEYTQKCSEKIVEFNKRYAAITYKIIPIVSRIKNNESGNIPDEIVNIAVSGNELYYKDGKSKMFINFSNIFNNILTPIAKEIKKNIRI